MFTKRNYCAFAVIIFASVLISFQLNAQTQKYESKNNNEIKSSDPWTAQQIITTKKLDELLSVKNGNKPVVLMIGFDFLYDQGHIPGAVFAGPASKEKGLEKLKKAVKPYNKNQEIVIYCGCCPFDHCPNVRPAFKTLEEMGYKNLKVLYLPNDFEQNWKDKGYKVSAK